MRVAKLIAIVPLSLVTLVGCDTGPKCLDWHTSTTPQTVYVNGKVSVISVTSTVCVKYEEPTDAR